MSDDGIPLADLKADDLVVVDSRHECVIQRIDRVTGTQIIIGATKYRRKDGKRIGGDLWWPESLKTSPHDFLRAKRQAASKGLQQRIDLTQESITGARQRLARVEAVLRECGEWKDES